MPVKTRKETFGKRLYRLREAKGLSQRQLASRTNNVCSAAYISRLETDERNASLNVMRHLAEALEVTALYLETGQNTVCPHCDNDRSYTRN